MATSTPVAQTGLFNRFWPSLITDEGQINHHGMIRRMETVIGLMVPGALTFYTVLESCHCPHSAMITLMCAIPVPAIFATVDEYRADSAFERIEALRKEKLASSQTPPPQRSILKNSGGKTPSLNGSVVQRHVVISDRGGYPSGAVPELIHSQS